MRKTKKFANASIIGTFLLFIMGGITIFLFMMLCSNPNTPAGYEGYVYEQPRLFGTGGFQGVLRGPANHGVSIWRNRVLNIDIRPNTYTEQFKILANDDLNIAFNFHAVLAIKQGRLMSLLNNMGVRRPFSWKIS